MRNVQLNTVAPTGTTSLSIGQNCSSGIEPIFALSFRRTIRTGVGDETRAEEVSDYAWKLWNDMRARGEISGAKFSAPAPDKAPPCFVTTVDIDPYRSIDMQAAFQKYIDHSISKTLNLPPATSFEEYKNLFMYGYERGLKGFTTFNPDGSMKGILEYSEKKEQGIKRRIAPSRPRDLPCDVHRVKAGKKSYLVITGFLDGSLYEIFVIDDPNETIDLSTEKKTVVRKVGGRPLRSRVRERGRNDAARKLHAHVRFAGRFARPVHLDGAPPRHAAPVHRRTAPEGHELHRRRAQRRARAQGIYPRRRGSRHERRCLSRVRREALLPRRLHHLLQLRLQQVPVGN
jgi:hypothetical protein